MNKKMNWDKINKQNQIARAVIKSELGLKKIGTSSNTAGYIASLKGIYNSPSKPKKEALNERQKNELKKLRAFLEKKNVQISKSSKQKEN